MSPGRRFACAVALLRRDRPGGLDELEACFAAGAVPGALEGAYAGRLLAVTMGTLRDVAAEGLARRWLPWLGKTFAAADGDGRNLLTPGGARAVRLTLPGYRGLRRESSQRWSGFCFTTSVGESAVVPGVDVLRIDYRDIAENPAWPVRRVLDELVEIEDGSYLGQALVHWRGGLRRAAWFGLDRRPAGSEDRRLAPHAPDVA